jgi:hypothetical protein
MRSLALLVLLVSVARAQEAAPPMTTLDGRGEPLRSLFAGDAGKLRLLILPSPS